MNELQELLEQKKELEAKIAEIFRAQREEAISTVRSLVEDFQLTEHEVFGRAKLKTAKAAKSVGEPKYLNPETNQTWTGQGRCPKWLEGKNRDDFLIRK